MKLLIIAAAICAGMGLAGTGAALQVLAAKSDTNAAEEREASATETVELDQQADRGVGLAPPPKKSTLRKVGALAAKVTAMSIFVALVLAVFKVVAKVRCIHRRGAAPNRGICVE